MLEDDELDVVLAGFCDKIRGKVRRRKDNNDDEQQQPETSTEDDAASFNHEQFTQYVLMTYGQNLNKILHDRTQKVIQKVKDDGLKYIQDFVTEKKKDDEDNKNGDPPKLVQTESGLVYCETKTGTGKSPDPNGECTVEIHYHGTLTDGTVFESTIDVPPAAVDTSPSSSASAADASKNNKYKSRAKKKNPTKSGTQTVVMPLHGCIRGLQEGIKLMKEGGRATIIVPYDLAYGDAKGSTDGIIPPGATLTYDIELYEVRDLSDFMKEHKISVNMQS